MNKNLALNTYQFENYLIDTYQDCIMGYTGVHYIFKFSNGLGASVVKTFGSQGYENDLWELQTIEFEDKDTLGPGPYDLIYLKEILNNDNSPIGNLTEHDVIKLLKKIKTL